MILIATADHVVINTVKKKKPRVNKGLNIYLATHGDSVICGVMQLVF